MKNNYFLLLSIALLTTLLTNAQVTIFKDDFSTASSRWNVYTTDKSQFAIYNGKAVLWDFDPTFNGARVEKIGTELDINTDFAISVNAAYTGGEKDWGYGLVFGANSNSPVSGYKFLIASSGHYCLSKWVNGSVIELIKWVKTDVVKKDNFISQKLEVRKQGNTWFLYVNDINVNTYPAQSLYGNYIGIVKDSKQRIEFDDLELVDLLQSNQPPVVYTNDCDAFNAMKKISSSKGLGSIRGNTYKLEDDGFLSYNFRFPSNQNFPGAQTTYIVASTDSKSQVPAKSEKHYVEAVYASGLTYQAAQEQFPIIQKKLADCLKNYQFNTYLKSNGKISYSMIGEKITGGFKTSSDALVLAEDPFKSGSYMVSLRVYAPFEYSKNMHLITNAPVRNNEFAKSLMQIIGYAATSFDGKKGSKIDGAGFMASRFSTSIKLQGALDNYIEDMLGRSFYAVMEKNLSEDAAKAKMNIWHQKLMQVLGNEYHYIQDQNKYSYDHAKIKETPYLNLKMEKASDGNGFDIIISIVKDISFEEDEEEIF